MMATQPPRRERRSVAERFRDFVHREYPLDKVGDERIDTLLDQLNDAFGEKRKQPE